MPSDQLMKALEVIESWLVRRMLVRAQTNAYNQMPPSWLAHLRKDTRTSG